MAFAATKKQGTISGYWFDDDFFLWRYAFTFSEPSAASKFLEIAKDGKSIQDAADAVGVEIECDSDENVVKSTSVGDRKATVITISEKLPCVEDWYKIAKSYDGKADVTCRALAQETGEKYFNYRYIGDGNKGQPVLVQGNVKESKEMEEEGKELVDIDNLKVEKDYIDDNGKIFDIYYDEDDYEDDEEPIEESRKPKDKRVYAEIYSYGIPSHITWFDNLKTAKRELENHIASMTKVGDYEIFRDEEAADIKMQEGDFEITLYVPSGSEDVVDNDVEHVIIRPKKEVPVKEGINNMEKHYVIVHQHLSNAQRLQIERAGFHVYSLQAQSATWGLGSQLQHRAFGSGHVADVITDFRALPNNQRAFKPDFDVFIEEVGAVEDEDIFKPILDKVLGKAEANESFDDTNSSPSKTDVTPVMNKIKVIGSPINKSDFLFYCREIIGEGGNPVVFWVHEGTGDSLDDEQEEQGFNDYIYYTIYEGVKYSTIDKFIYGDYDALEQFEGDSDFVYLYNNYRDLTVQQICWKILKNYGEDVPEKLTVRILEGDTAVDDFKRDAQKYTTGPITKKLVCYINYVDSNNDWWPIKAENIKTKSEAIEYLIKKYGKDCKDTFHITVLENKYRNGKVVHSEEIDNDRGTIAELSSRTKKSAQNESLIDDESHNIELSADKAAKFIKESVEWLLQEEMGCCTKELTPEVQLAVGWLNGYDPEDQTLIHSKEDPTWCICVGIVAADGDDMKTDLEWLTIPYVADGENEGDVFSELMEPLSPNDNYAKVFEYLAKEYEGILKEYDVHSDGKCFHKKGNAATEESIKPKKGKGGLTFKEKCRAAQRGFKYSPDLDYLMYEDEDMVIASDEAHIPSWDVLDSGDYDLYGREVTEDDTYLGGGDIPTLMDSMLYDGPWEKFTIRGGHVVGREPTDEQPA